MNPEVRALRKRMESISCARCANYNPRESLCELYDRYMDAQRGGCNEFIPARVTKWEKRAIKTGDNEEECHES